ncbi:MAG: DUF4058 family protein [Chloroflexota bacterium]
MRSPFPGMDPYLEQSGIWNQVHTGLIVSIQQFLTPKLRPKYRVAMEQRTYLTVSPPDALVGEPDVVVSVDTRLASHTSTSTVTASTEPLVGVLPMPQEVTERYLEVRMVDTKEVVTVIEILSPANKRAGAGRREYEKKRTEVLGSWTNLIEIDLLRAGKSLPMTVAKESHYRIVVSRSVRRPSADFYLFSIRQPIPNIPIPLLDDDPEPMLELNQLLHNLYDQSGFDLDIGYTQQPPPPAFSKEDSSWVEKTARSFLNSFPTNGSS